MRKEIEILPVTSANQQADYLTKAVPYTILKYLRMKTMGWYNIPCSTPEREN